MNINNTHLLIGLILLILVSIVIYIWLKTRRISSINDLPRNCNGLIISGIVTSISDGDGFNLFHTPMFRSTKFTKKDKKLKIRLAGIDAPEMRYYGIPAQPLSKESKQFLSNLILNKKVYIEILGIDKYERILAIVYLKYTCYSINVNIEMIKSGLACVYKGQNEVYGKYKKEMEEKQEKAIKNKIGMWGLNNLILPMDYKKLKRIT